MSDNESETYYPSNPSVKNLRLPRPLSMPPLPSAVLLQLWSSQLFDCVQDPANCLITTCFPCITFGQTANIVDQGMTNCDKWTHIFAPDDIYLPLGVLTYVSSEADSTVFSGRGSVSRALFMPSVTLAPYARSTVNSSTVVSKCNLDGHKICNCKHKGKQHKAHHLPSKP